MDIETDILLKEWNSLLYLLSNFDNIQKHVIHGELKNSPFRTIYWRLMLDCLPRSHEYWKDTLTKDRADYDIFKKSINIKPDEEIFGLSLDVNNPLSLESESPWNQYFVDENIKELISKDVQRTFPDIEFFNKESTYQILKNVLFVYAKKNPDLSYRQGMHEVLAIIVYALHCDYNFYKKCENYELILVNQDDAEFLKFLHDQRYIEHDSYFIFSKVMNILSDFYSSANDNGRSSSTYIDINDQITSATWIKKLDNIINNRLKNFDFELWNHLKALDINPRLYGLRWLRLLFGREFQLNDLFFLWDVIFSDSPSFDILDDIFLAMLIHIRKRLLNSDYSDGLQLLMRYPPINNIQQFVNLCLHLNSPMKYPKPFIYEIGTLSPNLLPGKSNNIQKKKNITNRQLSTVSTSAYETPAIYSTRNYYSVIQNEEIELLKEQVALLQTSLNDKELISQMASVKLKKLVSELESMPSDNQIIKKMIDEIKEIAKSLSHDIVPCNFSRSVSIRPEQYQLKTLDPNNSSEKFRQRSFSSSSNKSLMRHTPRSLLNDKELKELHFGIKKNF